MEDQGVRDLRELARNVPGLTIGSAEGGNAYGAFAIRGFKANNDIFVDSIRNPGNVIPDVFAVEQIEIYKGPSGGIAGRSTIGGAINLITKQPDLNFNYYEVDDDDRHRQHLPHHDRCEPGRHPRLRRARQPHVRPARYRRPRHRRQRAVGRPVLGHGEADGRREGHARLLPLSQRCDSGLGRSGAHPDNGSRRRYSTERHPSADHGIRLSRATCSSAWRPRFLQGAGRHRHGDSRRQAGRRHDVDQQDRGLGRAASTTSPRRWKAFPTCTIRNRDQTAQIYANQTELNVKFTTGTFKHNVVAGLEVTRENIDRDAYLSPTVSTTRWTRRHVRRAGSAALPAQSLQPDG